MSQSLYARLNNRFGAPVSGMQRREFLRASLVAGAGLLLSGAAARAALASRFSAAAKRIVVIGGGFSGLTAAYELQAAGYDVTLVEGRDKVGGRVLSFNDANKNAFIPGRNIEGGAELIGSNHPLWVAYAEKFGLKFLDVTEDAEAEFPIVLQGKKLSLEASAAVWEELDRVCNEMNALAEPIDADEPWKSPAAAELDAKSIRDWINSLKATALTKQALAAQFAGDNGVANDKASLLGMLACVKGGGLEKYWTESEVYRCEGGNQQLAFKLAAALGDRVTTGLRVRSVEQKGDKLAIACADGRTIECDDVVLAVPPSVWGNIEFRPGLPATVTGAKAPQMGTNVKYLAHVKSRFWKPLKQDPVSLGDDDISWTWDATDNQTGDADVCHTAFSGGPAAERARSRKGAERDAAYSELFELRYRGFKENFVKARMMDWPADPLTLAGYSFPAPGQVTSIGPALAQGTGRIHFAGEHCCYKFVGYMEGALQAGAAVARRLAARDGIK